MTDYKMEGGVVYSDEDIEAFAASCERGEYPGEAGRWIVRPKGRPLASADEEELVTIAFKVPRTQRDAIDHAARGRGESRSQYIRETLARAMA